MADVVTLKFEPEIKGEAKQEGHEEEINIENFSFGGGRAAQVSDLQGDTLGSAPMISLSMSKGSDKASSPMFKACLEGTRFDKATIYVLRNTSSGTETSFELTLEKVVIDSMQYGTSAGSPGRGTESFSLVAAKIKGRAEKMDFTWDFLANTP
jgi:type VI secretion system secreted protein Hcp